MMFCLILFIFSAIISSTKGGLWSTEYALTEYLFKNVSPNGRPLLNHSHSVDVHIGLEVAQIIVSTKAQQLTISGFFRMKWTNELISWDPTQYNGIKTLNVDPDLFWIPEVVLHNSVKQDRNWITHLLQTKVSIEHTGVSYWLSPIDFTSTCSFNIKRFPYDTQNCSITFGPWSDDMGRVRLIANGLPIITKAGYIPNVEWNVAGSQQLIDKIYYTCCPVPFTNLQVYLTLSRKPSFYTIICIVPCVFLLGILFLGHGLPPQSGERITLSMMISLTCILMMEYTSSKILPQTANISSLSKIYLIVAIIISLSIFTTCFVLTLYHRISSLLWFPRFLEKRYIPRWLWTESILKRSDNLIEMESIIGHSNRQSEAKMANLDAHMTMNEEGFTVTGKENEKLKSILDEVRNYNKKSSKPEKAEVIFQQRAIYIAIFLDKIFILFALVIITAAILLDIFT